MQSLSAASQVPALLMEIEGGEGVDVPGKMAAAYKMLEEAEVAS
jgi:hypothetical protein